MSIQIYSFYGDGGPGSGGGIADVRPVAIDGPLSLHVGQSARWQITDYDAFSEYLVQSSDGMVSVDGDVITYTAPSNVGKVTLTIRVNGVARSLAIDVLPPAVAPPALIAPTDGATGIPETPTLVSAAFAVFGSTDTHIASRWRIWSADGQALIYDSGPTTDLTTHVLPRGVLQPSTTYRIEVAHQGQSLGWSEYGARITITTSAAFFKVAGLVQVATGGGAGTYHRIDENFVAVTRDAAWFNNHSTYAGIVTQVIDGQQMVKIPKFYFKAGTVPSGIYAGKAYWMISDRPAEGFSMHPAFIGAGGAELDQIWVGKYQASASGGKLQSVAGVLPRVSMDFPTARAEAYARNTGGVTGFRLWSIYDLSAIQMLATIEMGGLDMQSLIGQGRVNQSSAANVDASDVAQATWRGIVGLWGNVWQMTDGINRNGGNWHRWQYNVPGSTTTSDFSTGYVNTSRPDLTSSGWIVTFDITLLASGIIAPATVDATQSNGSTGDYHWSDANTDDRIWYHGGSCADGANAGLFCAGVDHDPPYNHSRFGARLAKV